MKKILLLTMLSGVVLLNSSCKKSVYGCADPNALNYSSEANSDDGSCIYDSDVNSGGVIVEEFSITFSPGNPDGIYSPNFITEDGDIIIMEAESDYIGGNSYWTQMPYLITQNVLIWGEYSESSGACYIYSDYVSTGGDVTWNSAYTQYFRVALVKKTGLIKHPEIKNMSISEIEELNL